MARGLPCIATYVGANADMLNDGCGIITTVGDVDSIENALRCLKDMEIRKQMSKKSLEKVRCEYSADVIIESFCHYYNVKEKYIR